MKHGRMNNGTNTAHKTTLASARTATTETHRVKLRHSRAELQSITEAKSHPLQVPVAEELRGCQVNSLLVEALYISMQADLVKHVR